ncbi:DUF5753 domain-containing protein [Actinomadura atramentaria]|uniref:DUF5753 domain-containing protein n=1 Tax=Actinomadura atramentaria TaxID=1990 RepID=UPI00196A1BDF|nr:DUF5753 domain-containing protein [Actinomadura atramentaria]
MKDATPEAIMANAPKTSTVPRRQLGRHLRRLRLRIRMDVQTAIAVLEISETTLWRIENGWTSVRPERVAAMCKAYEAPPRLTSFLTALALEGKARGWWHAYGDTIPEGFDLYISMEESAGSMDQYSPELIPGLLQTEEYVRALFARNEPQLPAAEVDNRVRLRMQRQMLFTRKTAPTRLRVVLNEAVVRRPIGSPATMAAQLQQLAETNELPNASIRVMPFAAGAHRGLDTGPFTLMRFAPIEDGHEFEPPTVYMQGYTGELYLDKPREIDQFTKAFAEIWNDALSEEDSTALFRRTAKEMDDDD